MTAILWCNIKLKCYEVCRVSLQYLFVFRMILLNASLMISTFSGPQHTHVDISYWSYPHRGNRQYKRNKTNIGGHRSVIQAGMGR